MIQTGAVAMKRMAAVTPPMALAASAAQGGGTTISFRTTLGWLQTQDGPLCVRSPAPVFGNVTRRSYHFTARNVPPNH